jgi:hypothetical protein
MSEPQNLDEKIGANQTVGAITTAKCDYEIGRGRPPKEYQWKKGQSGNPSGRPRKKLDQKTLYEKIIAETVTIRENGKERKVPKYDALIRSHYAKGINGEVASAKLVMEEAARLGAGQQQDDDAFALLPPFSQSVPSDALFANLNADLLSDEDKIELARIGKVINLGGDVTALNAVEFARLKQITDKGRGKDVTPRA